MWPVSIMWDWLLTCRTLRDPLFWPLLRGFWRGFLSCQWLACLNLNPIPIFCFFSDEILVPVHGILFYQPNDRQLLALIGHSVEFRGGGRLIIGGAHIHIFVFTDCKNNRFQKKLMMQNTNIRWIWAPPHYGSSAILVE